MIPQGKRDLGASGIQGARHAVQGRPGPPPSHPEAERHPVTNWGAYDTAFCPASARADRSVVASRAARVARAAGCPVLGQARGHPGPAAAGCRARGALDRDVRTIRWGRVVRAWSGRLLRFRWHLGLLHGPVPPTSARPADHRPGCPAAGSPAWCPGWGSAPAPGCPGPPRPADGSPRPVCRYQGASRGRLRVAKCRARGGRRNWSRRRWTGRLLTLRRCGLRGGRLRGHRCAAPEGTARQQAGGGRPQQDTARTAVRLRRR